MPAEALARREPAIVAMALMAAALLGTLAAADPKAALRSGLEARTCRSRVFSAYGTKQTSSEVDATSAFDPKRTFTVAFCRAWLGSKPIGR